jgi:hypothetical protein
MSELSVSAERQFLSRGSRPVKVKVATTPTVSTDGERDED